MLEKRFVDTHEDEYPNKRPITKQEIDFLKQLQLNMNTQDHICQADPRYWVIRDYAKVYGENLNNYDGLEIYVYKDGGPVNVLLDNSNITNDIEKMLDAIINELVSCLYIDKDSITEEQKQVIIDYSYDLYSMVEEFNNTVDEVELSIQQYGLIPFDTNVFFSHQEAKDYLASREYKFSSKAHTYALTTESSEINKLFKILHEVDFDKLIGE
jgi:hypothetical protein